MRLDLFLSTVGVIKRRTEAKEKADAGMISINGRTGKPGAEVHEGDIVFIGGAQARTVEILRLPQGSVRKDARAGYFRDLPLKK